MVSASLALLLLFAAVLGIVAHLVDARGQAMLVAASLAHVLMLAAVPGAALAAVAFGWWGLAAGAAVLTGAIATQLPLQRHRPLHRHRSRTTTEAPTLTVLHANIWLGQADLDALVALVEQHRPDVLTLVELTPEAEARLRPRLSGSLPHAYVSAAPGGEGTGIYSRFPLVDEQRHDGFVTELLSARVEMPGRPLVFAVHPVPPWPREPSEWVRELALLRQLLAKIPVDDGPVVVAGDFNATQDHRRYRDLQDGRFVDAAVATGAGMLRTYPAHTWYPPVIAIDHVLVADMAVRSVEAVTITGSDHRGILARLAFGPH
ncbi:MULTISPECIES: endonuclease/exonuclease/phosphatase family protein [unclassified Rhodococcus (in: high G+C Gram-positive bacteria)]|uniref:endonuclease/exonuclease/phosphatase family protein n=1 Tax=unclassified Rhodococcus (in: high G+C Gram-positive bacteria) TaxID=192944 RepID=UPI0029541A41|nr:MULTISPECIES: endonuclease/exonuclease/phosphatase family protein [unclassified Rhodococcus (in: high G+C Gram-positive bacteria)]MDV8057694.1 endonuclease/exonuclease/phosphatase family protein [Rhodococcus sp. IEGM 1343]MDV8076750.1 endonuclease/exonuclease/phosphatase family protein [Rhodococcus sp. IEGM 1370]